MADNEKLRIVGWGVAALVAVLLGARLLGSGGRDRPAPVSVDSAGATPAATATHSPGGSGPELMVQVAGEVARPGVYRVPAGSRVTDAVTRAGGLTHRADQAGVNLVARVQDGQQVVVPRRGAGGALAGVAAGAGGSAAPGAASGPVSLSSATVAQLDTLDGIGPTLAQRIVEYRQAHGGFSSIDQLRQVDGIGEKRFAALKKGVTP
ncbi:MAG: competence protein ComEA [Thermoleophilaceae bacterium]|nr:competence protein ComEA [Thermoleophilaceae bacterium]